jgi:hypothetical protein
MNIPTAELFDIIFMNEVGLKMNEDKGVITDHIWVTWVQKPFSRGLDYVFEPTHLLRPFVKFVHLICGSFVQLVEARGLPTLPC